MTFEAFDSVIKAEFADVESSDIGPLVAALFQLRGACAYQAAKIEGQAEIIALLKARLAQLEGAPPEKEPAPDAD